MTQFQLTLQYNFVFSISSDGVSAVVFNSLNLILKFKLIEINYKNHDVFLPKSSIPFSFLYYTRGLFFTIRKL